MGIPAKKKEYLKLFMSDEDIAKIEAGNASTAKEANEAGIESKEATPETPVVEEVAETPAVETTPEAPAEKKEQEVPEGMVTMGQLTEVVKQMTEAIGEAFKSIKTEIEEIKSAQTKEATDIQNLNIPAASLSAMIAKNLSVVGSPETQVRKNSTLLKSGPEETPASDENKVIASSNPVLNDVFTRIIRGS